MKLPVIRSHVEQQDNTWTCGRPMHYDPVGNKVVHWDEEPKRRVAQGGATLDAHRDTLPTIGLLDDHAVD
jgi:hypothetical protein